MTTPAPQPLPACARYPRRRCPGDCQYILPAHACIHDIERPSFTCPRCGMTSHHPKDIEQGYCGNCHDWTRKND